MLFSIHIHINYILLPPKNAVIPVNSCSKYTLLTVLILTLVLLFQVAFILQVPVQNEHDASSET